MLYILYGATAEMGRWSRRYFVSKGMELIEKFHYIPEEYPLTERFGKRTRLSKEDVLKCDFVYERNHMLIGFNKEQIIDAVRGRKNCLLTATGESLDFIRQIKAAYGGYVTVIGIYIDEHTLRDIFSVLPSITEKEVEDRLQIGEEAKKNYLLNRSLFDYLVVYGGEDSSFNMEAMKLQYDDLLERTARIEKELNDRMYVEIPYTGNDEYVFVSYSHQDIQTVFPVLRKLQLAGFRIWYDEGINGGENWRKILASKIEHVKCKNILLFSSAQSVQSRHVQAEINLALNCEKKIVTVRLDETRFTSDLEMYLTLDQHLTFSENPVFIKTLIQTLDQAARIS